MSLSAEQLRNAVIIYQVGQRMGMSTRDIQIGLIAAMQESGLRNLHYGDRDSQGLFQQRPSQGWGTVQQVTDPRYAAGKFFKTLHGLGERRYNMSMGQAAQAVQRSAYPDRYANHIGLIRSIFPKIQARAGDDVRDMGGRPFAITDPSTVDIGDITYREGEKFGLVGQDFVDSYGPTSASVGAVETDPLAAANSAIAAPDTAPLSANYGAPEEQAPAMPEIPTPSGPQPWQTFIGPHTNQSLADSGAFGFQKGLDGWRAAAVQAAEDLIGTPYVWGGNGRGGVDCSGLTSWAYNKAGKHLPRVSYQQANSGKRVKLSSLRPGDLVAWDNSSRNNGADHIAIYAGNGMIIEAARPGTNVRRRRLGHNEGAWGVRMG